MPATSPNIAIIIVGYQNSEDICNCLLSLADANCDPVFNVFICENGGGVSFDALRKALIDPAGPCRPSEDSPTIRFSSSARFLEVQHLALKRRSCDVWLAQAASNLGYAGGINAWLQQLQKITDWTGLWILNPDSEPRSDALKALVEYANNNRKGMVGSTIIPEGRPSRIHCRAIGWNKWLARTISIGYNECAEAPCDIRKIEAEMQAPSGASMYLTRSCFEHIGLMDERFFLYFEDLDWGLRAKSQGLGYAPSSVVLHKGGTTIGKSSGARRDRSQLSVYLQFRNLLIFCRKHYSTLLPVTNLMALLYASLYLISGAPLNFMMAMRGIIAAWNGEIGAPNTGNTGSFVSRLGRGLTRKSKILLSAAYYCVKSVHSWIFSKVGLSPSPRLVILYYHGVKSDYHFEFTQQIEMLSRLANVVPADFQGPLAADKLNVAITFDDAFFSIIHNALPVLLRYSFPATVFVPAAMIGTTPIWKIDDPSAVRGELVMTSDELRSISRCQIKIGSHGLSHRHLSTLDAAETKCELEQSRDLIKDVIGDTVDLFAFPYGDYNERTKELCKTAGYRYAFSTEPISINVTESNFVRGRVKIDPSDSKLEFFLKISGALGWSVPLMKLRKRLSFFARSRVINCVGRAR